ncbi:MAG TPA: response regulator, partial [Vicinamibacterales bacterium]|nr:response regulator [Vicinamibacterales bacterium]
MDDDEDFLFQHRIQLENAGFQVAAAASRAAAEELIGSFTPDLAIVDLMMEHHDDGFVLSHHLKRRFPAL